MKKHKPLWLVLALVLAFVFLICLVILISQWNTRQTAEREYTVLTESAQESSESQQDTVTVPESAAAGTAEPAENDAFPENGTLSEQIAWYADTFGIEVPERSLDFEALQADTNADIYAWIYVPGTNIDYPVLQHPTDDTYYLNYNLDGSKGYPGCIYSESCNSMDFTDRMTVLYGHNMKNGTMFGSLHNFEDEAVFDEYRYIFVYLPEKILVYEIFAAYEGSNNHIIYGHEWDDESWVQYLEDTLTLTGENDNAVDSYEFTVGDKVLTLSTCVRNVPNKRFLVQGVLLDEAK